MIDYYGQIGEFVSSVIPSGSQIALTTNTPVNVTKIVLDPGDWEIWGAIVFTGLGTTAVANNPQLGSASLVSATQAPTFDLVGSYPAVVTTTGFTGTLVIPRQRLNFFSPLLNTVFLVATGVFSAGTLNAYGSIYARRVR